MTSLRRRGRDSILVAMTEALLEADGPMQEVFRRALTKLLWDSGLFHVFVDMIAEQDREGDCW